MASRFQISYDLDAPPQHVIDAGLHLAARYETLATLGGYGQSIRAVDLPDGWMAYIVNLPHSKTVHFVGENAELAARRQEEYVKPGTTVVPILYHYTGISTNQELVAAASEIAELAGYGSDFADLASLKTSTTYFIDNTAWAVHSYELSNAKSYSDVACFKLGIPVDAAIRKVSSDSTKFQGYRCDPKRYTGMLPMVIQLLLGVGRVVPSEVDDDKTDIEYAKDSRAASLTDDDLQSYGSMTLDDAVDSGLSMSLKYDYRWGRTHGIVWARRTPKTNAPFIQSADPDRIWEPFLCEIGTRGILLMPLPRDGASFDSAVRDVYLSLNPTLRHSITDTHAIMPTDEDYDFNDELTTIAYFYDVLAQDRLGANADGDADLFWVFGGFPTDECFPQDDAKLERLIDSGVVIRLTHPLLEWFYSNKAVSLDHGWAFTKFTSLMNPFFPSERSMATNVCYEENGLGHATYSHSVVIEFDIFQGEREYTSLAQDVISSLGLTKFTDIYKATLLTDEQAIAILASGSYEDFLALSCSPEWVASVDISVRDSGAICVPVTPYLPNLGVVREDDFLINYYAFDFLEDYSYLNEPILLGPTPNGRLAYTTRLYDYFRYKTWDSLENRYTLFGPYNPYADTVLAPPISGVPGLELAPYKSFFVLDTYCCVGRFKYYIGTDTRFEPTTLKFYYSGFYRNYLGRYTSLRGNIINMAGYYDLLTANSCGELSTLSQTLSFFGFASWVPDNYLALNSAYAVGSAVGTYYSTGWLSIPQYVRNRCNIFGDERGTIVILDVKDSRAGVFVLSFEDWSVNQVIEFDSECYCSDPGDHYQLLTGYIYALECYDSLFLCYALRTNDPSGISYGHISYPYQGHMFVTDSLWDSFKDYSNPLQSPPPVEYFKLHCGGSEELYISTGISPDRFSSSDIVYLPEYFYFVPLESRKAFELRNYIFSEQIPLDSVPFGCFPWHRIA